MIILYVLLHVGVYYIIFNAGRDVEFSAFGGHGFRAKTAPKNAHLYGHLYGQGHLYTDRISYNLFALWFPKEI